MKTGKIIASILAALLSHSAQAAPFNPEAYLAANPDVRAAGLGAYQHVAMISGEELAGRLAAADALVKKATISDVKVMFCDCAGMLDENSVIQQTTAWYLSQTTGKSTIKDMIKSGWQIQTTIAINAKQYYIVFIR